jgi:hypothetical protein
MISNHAEGESNPVNKTFWDETRNHDYSDSFPGVSRYIHQKASLIRTPDKTRRYKILIIAGLLPLLVFLSCQRKTYMQPHGATLTFMVIDSLSPAVEHAVRQHAEKEWGAVFRPHAGAKLGTVYTPVEQYEKLRSFAEKLKAMPGVSEVVHTAMRTRIKESAVSRLSYQLFNQHIDDINETEEWRSEIATRLKATGVQNLQLDLVKGNGNQQVKLVPIGKTRDLSLDFALRDGTIVTAKVEQW